MIDTNHALKDAKDDTGITPLIIAAGSGSKKVVSLLVDKVDVNLKGGKQGRTALHWAVQNDNLEITEVLINNNNINLDISDNNGDTVLALASKKSDERLVDIIKAKISEGNNTTITGEKVTAAENKTIENDKQIQKPIADGDKEMKTTQQPPVDPKTKREEDRKFNFLAKKFEIDQQKVRFMFQKFNEFD